MTPAAFLYVGKSVPLAVAASVRSRKAESINLASLVKPWKKRIPVLKSQPSSALLDGGNRFNSELLLRPFEEFAAFTSMSSCEGFCIKVTFGTMQETSGLNISMSATMELALSTTFNRSKD
jgi:hypothetical protein